MEYVPSSGTLQDATENRDQYKAWELPRRDPLPEAPERPPGAPFEGTSTAHDAYKAYPIEPRRQVRDARSVWGGGRGYVWMLDGAWVCDGEAWGMYTTATVQS